VESTTRTARNFLTRRDKKNYLPREKPVVNMLPGTVYTKEKKQDPMPVQNLVKKHRQAAGLRQKSGL